MFHIYWLCGGIWSVFYGIIMCILCRSILTDSHCKHMQCFLRDYSWGTKSGEGIIFCWRVGGVFCTLGVSSPTIFSGSYTCIFLSSVSWIVPIPVCPLLVKFMFLFNIDDCLGGGNVFLALVLVLFSRGVEYQYLAASTSEVGNGAPSETPSPSEVGKEVGTG